MEYRLEEGLFSEKINITIKLKRLPSDDDAKEINKAITALKKLHEKYTQPEAQA